MKRTIIGLILFCCSFNFTAEAQDRRQAVPSQPPDVTATVQQLAAEVRKLQLSLNDLQVELQQSKVSRTEDELKQAQTARQRLATRRLELQYEIDIINSRLNEPESSAEARPQLEAQKQQLGGRVQEKLLADEMLAAQRDAEIGERLDGERKRLQELTEQNKQLRQHRK